MRKKNVFIYTLSVVMISCMLMGCGTKQDEATDNTSTEEQQTANQEYIVVDTEFGGLYYQEQWNEFMRTEQNLDGDVLTVSFNAEINENTYPLFKITIGGDAEGAIGELTDAEGTKRNVYASMEELEMSSELTEGEQDRLYAMQEDINYVIEHLE